ncbi:deoxyribodipyrimidine photolyase [Vibrio sp. JCM 19236]|nr:deoxyribodipyrimidine photolyase [Vibrio sp. JCM 19236]
MSQDSNVIALFIETPGQWQEHNLAPIQADLILRRLHEVSAELKELNISMIFERCDSFSDCADVLSRLCQQHHINRLWANKEYELNEVKRDELVAETLTNVGVESRFIDDSCMFSPGEVLNQQGSYFKVFTPFKKAWLSKFASRPVPVSKPPRLEHNALTIQSELSFNYPLKDSSAYPISTKEIITKLREFAADKASDYSEDRDFPAIEGTSKLSPYLAIGALSVRQCLARLFNGRHLEELSAGEQTWLSELIWREFYQHLLYFEPKLSRGQCFTPWGDMLVWQGDEEHLEKWQQGETGYPIVDAAMKQLNHTGWMHNRLRMIVASFLTKDLLLDWHDGEAYFSKTLVDGDYGANNGGWQWSASTGCDAQPYFRIFNPISQGRSLTPMGAL